MSAGGTEVEQTLACLATLSCAAQAGGEGRVARLNPLTPLPGVPERWGLLVNISVNTLRAPCVGLSTENPG